MLFQARFWAGLRDGSITCTFRRWKRAQVVAGKVYRTPGGRLHVEAIDAVEPEAITDADAVSSGYPSADALRADLRDREGTLFRVRFSRVEGEDPRAALARDDALTDGARAAIEAALRRIDNASRRGPWTAAVLRLIAEHPGVRAPDLAAHLDRDPAAFKRDVRKLKALGLTLSLEVGYRLSPRGAAYLNSAA